MNDLARFWRLVEITDSGAGMIWLYLALLALVLCFNYGAHRKP